MAGASPSPDHDVSRRGGVFTWAAWFLASLAFLSVVLAALPIFVGTDRVISAFGGWVTGYHVSIRGGSSLRLGTSLTAPVAFTAEDVVVSLPPDRFTPVDSPPLLRLARIEADVGVWALAFGRMALRNLRLVRPGMRFDRSSDGTTNWSLRDKPRLGAGGGPAGWSWGRLSVRDMIVEGGTIRVTGHRLVRDLSLTEVNVESGLFRTSGETAFRLRGDALHMGDAVYVEGELSRLGDYLAGTRAPFTLSLIAPPGETRAKGTIAGRGRPAVTAEISIDLDAPEELAHMWPGMPAALNDPLAARAQASLLGGRAVLVVRSFLLGKTDIAGRAEIDFNEKLPQMSIDLDAGALDFDHLAALARSFGLFVESMPEMAPDLLTVDGDARLNWRRMVLPWGEIGAGMAGLSWRAGVPNLAIETASLPLFGGTLGGRFELTASEGKTALSVNLTANDIAAEDLLRAGSGGGGVVGRLHGTAEILAVGSRPDDLLSASVGSGRLSLSEGRIFGSALQRAVAKDRRDLRLGRASMDFRLEGGVLSSPELLMDFDIGHARAAFDWDLAADDASLRFQPSPIHEGAAGPVILNGRLRELLVAR